MFAVLKTGGKQYKVQAGDVLRVEKLAATAGEKIQFNDILMLGGETLTVGSPLVAGAAVQAEVIDQIKAQLSRMVPVHEVHDLTVDGPAVQRELALFKVAGKGEHRIEALRLAEQVRAAVGEQQQVGGE